MIEFLLILCVLVVTVAWIMVSWFWFGKDLRDEIGAPLHMCCGIVITYLALLATWILWFKLFIPYLKL